MAVPRYFLMPSRTWRAASSKKFSVPYGGGAWQVDDVLVDPYSFG